MAKKVKKWFQSTDAFELGAIIFIVVGIILVLTAIGLGIKTRINLEGGDSWENITTYSEFIAGLIGGVWSLAGVLLFYSSLSSQKADLEAQKDLLVKQIDEVVAQTKEFRIQNEMAKDQKNEETFFQLLRFHNEIITSIELEQADMDFATGENQTKTVVGRKAFVEYYDIFKRFFGETSENIQADSQENLARLFDTCYNTFYLEYQADLGHYFRNLYNILRYIKSVKKETRPFFLSLLIAQLSNYELTMLFFHCLRTTNKDFKELVEEFEVLAQVPKDEVTSMAYVLYDIKAFGDDGFGSGDILDLDDSAGISEDSLLGKYAMGADSISHEGPGKPSSKDFMDDLLARLKGAQDGTNDIDEKTEKEIVIEGDDGGDFLNQFFDKQEIEKEKKKSKLLVEKEKVEEKEKETLDIDSLISTSKEENDSDDSEIIDLDLFKDTHNEIETSEDYNQSPELSKIKDQFKMSSPEINETDNDIEDEDDSLDLSMFMDSGSDDESEPFDLGTSIDIETSETDYNGGSDYLQNFADDNDDKQQNADDLLESLKKENTQAEQNSNLDNDLKNTLDLDESLNFEKSNLDKEDKINKDSPKTSDESNQQKSDLSNKTKKKVKIKPRDDDNKDKGGKGFLSKL